MKKMIKMSLVAAVAVAGLTTTSSAANLEDAIKGTKLTGYVRYRINTDHEAATDMREEGKFVAKITTPVNDMVTANVKMVGEAKTDNADTTNVKGTTKAPLSVTEGNFVIKAGGATVIAGLQTSQSPFFANNGDTRSHGVTALIPAGPVTVAAAYYTTTTPALGAAAMTNNVTALGALGKFGVISANLWYATAQDGTDIENNIGALDTAFATATALSGASATSIDLTAKAGPLNVQLMKTMVSTDNFGDEGVTKLVATGKAGNISYMAAYAMSEDDGGRVALDGDTDSIADIGLDNISMSEAADATAFAVSAKIAMDSGVCASAAYLTGDANSVDFNELDLKVGYKMSKNFKASLLYATGDKLGTDFGYSQIEVKYTF